MKKIIVAVLMVTSLVLPAYADTAATLINSYITDTKAPHMFTDMEDALWAAPSVESLTSFGIVSGFEDGTFRPDNNITKAEFVKIVVSAFGLYNPDAAVTLTDNNPDDWYYIYVSSAMEKGVASADETGMFNAEENITREEMFDISKKAIDFTEISLIDSATPLSFSDEADIHPNYKDAITYMVSGGIVTGNPDGTLLPKANSTRAEACVMIMRMLNSAIANEKTAVESDTNTENIDENTEVTTNE